MPEASACRTANLARTGARYPPPRPCTKRRTIFGRRRSGSVVRSIPALRSSRRATSSLPTVGAACSTRLPPSRAARLPAARHRLRHARRLETHAYGAAVFNEEGEARVWVLSRAEHVVPERDQRDPRPVGLRPTHQLPVVLVDMRDQCP